MHAAKAIAANLYYHGTLAYRLWRLQRACAERRAPIGILVFHRVANDRANAWTTSIPAFTKAIRWLKDHVDLISLEESQRRIRSGMNDRVSACITFNDGYADNFRNAIPLLIEAGIACTYFVSVGPVVDGVPFEHDVVNGNRLAPNTIDQLRSLADTCVEIGAHTRTHPNLGQISNRERLIDEVVRARDDLARILDRRIRYFAFPFGRPANMTVETVQLARDAGYKAVCSAYGGYNLPGGDHFHLKRRCLDGSLLRIKNWVTVDPFRNRHFPEFTYDQEPHMIMLNRKTGS